MDQYDTFSQIEKTLRESNIAVASLQSKGCGTLKAAVSRMTSQFTKLKSGRQDMQVLKGWYRGIIYIFSVEITENSVAMTTKILVVIVEDFECFENSVLSDLISLCR